MVFFVNTVDKKKNGSPKGMELHGFFFSVTEFKVMKHGSLFLTPPQSRLVLHNFLYFRMCNLK